MEDRKIYLLVMPNKRLLKDSSFQLIMAFIRRKKVKGKTYYYIVESYKEKGRVKQRVLLYLGTAESVLDRLKTKA
jgi:hypothetical protein